MKRLMIVLAILLLSAAPDGRMPYEKAVSSTVWIEAGNNHGTGVFVGKQLILTACHVVESQPSIRVHFAVWEGGAVVSDKSRYASWMACSVIAIDKGKDLALLRVSGQGMPMTVARGLPMPGDPLFAIGCGDGTALFGFSSGHLRQVYHAEFDRPRGVFSAKVLDMSVPVNMGDSGGPVVDARGELAGMISFIDGFKNQTYVAISAAEIRAFLAEAKQ